MKSGQATWQHKSAGGAPKPQNRSLTTFAATPSRKIPKTKNLMIKQRFKNQEVRKLYKKKLIFKIMINSQILTQIY